ncbi:MAG: DEAD/DEAH box helicase family protein [Marinilabiliaceae bacterium]|nr:DEAD/DEAH box helicase family protein [Marinilabiliaceae bacterium]
MAKQEIGEYITEFIELYTMDTVKQKGKKLYRDGRVTLQLYRKDLDTWIFSVKGSKMYKLHIRNLNNRYVETSCSCRFTGGSVCKHAVAALLYLADVDADVETGMNRRRAESALTPSVERPEWGLELRYYHDITEGQIEDLTSYSAFRDVKYGYGSGRIKHIQVEEKRIQFILDTPYVEDARVSFKYDNGKVYVSSSEKVMSNNLNEIEAYCLLKIAQSNTPNLLELIFDNKYKEDNKRLYSEYGLGENADFYHYFTFGFDHEKGLIAVPTEFATGILPVDENHQLVQDILTNLDKDTLFLNAIENLDKQEREMGFVLSLINPADIYSESNRIFEVMPLIGKPNKDKTLLGSHVEEYDGGAQEYLIKRSKGAEELMDIQANYSSTTDEANRFHVQKRAMELLAKEKHVYLRPGNYYGKLKKSDLKSISISENDIDVNYQVTQDSTFVGLELKLSINGEVVDIASIDRDKSGEFIYFINNAYHIATDYRAACLINRYAAPLKMVKSHKDQFLKQLIQPLATQVDMQFSPGVYDIETVELDFQKKQIFLSEKKQHLVITPKVQYHHGQSVQLNTHGNVLVEEEGQLVQYKRNFELEQDFVDFITSLHDSFDAQKSHKLFHIHHQDFSKEMWFYKFFDILQMNNVEVYGLKDLKGFKYSPHKGHVSTSVSSGQDWFEVNIEVTFGDNKVKLSDIRKAVLKNQRYIQLKDGSVGILPTEWFHKFEKYFRHGEIQNDKLAVSKLRFSIIDDLFDNIDDEQILDELNEKRQKLANFTEIAQTTIPEEITADLRPYQKEGLNWLNFLHEMNWGGILADDMGLGKTLQVLTFVQRLVKENETPNLVVIPTTLLFNWENEINKFAPNLKALYHYGSTRASDTAEFDQYNLIFTTYGTLLRDIPMLSEFQFNYIILDESQAIKNPASRRFKAANLLKANNRIALSGTPIENSTFDLYAQMSFVNRGFLGAMNGFKENFSNAIDKEGDEVRAAELQRLINPFILRRTKEKVASELPPKTEDVIICDMEPAQRKVYDAYRNKYRNQLLGNVEEEGIGKTKMMVLEALIRLRQICDSPVLLRDEKIDVTESVKIREIIQHITDKTANHKILIFSQFVQMLKLVKDELISRSIPFEYLDGKSTSVQRERSVNNFQENEELRVFLISLKAGGTGLNLTAADYVFILDPWWNPAVENQAIDRCYRIGQDKKVFAYRMICKDTVEEKILKLQARKKKIAGDIVQTDENIMKTLDVEDIQELFS